MASGGTAKKIADKNKKTAEKVSAAVNAGFRPPIIKQLQTADSIATTAALEKAKKPEPTN